MFRFSPRPNRAHLIRWREWGPEPFQEAEAQNKPVMMCLCAFWCGVCQRMDETAFSDEEVIALVNAYFVPVRVEDAQRPDVDVRYNQGGWPTIVFMTPSGGHLVSINSLPPGPFGDVLVRVHQAFREQRAEIEAGIEKSEAEVAGRHPDQVAYAEPEAPMVAEVAGLLMSLADPVHGGYGTDSKFPDVDANDLLLRQYGATGDRRLLDHVTLTLDRMRASRTHDEWSGGFFRYSSKPDWNEPHREKLLMDQAGLLSNYLHAYLLTDSTAHRETAEEIVGFLGRQLTDPDTGAFYGCEDHVRGKRPELEIAEDDPPGWFTIIDRCVYTDANARAISAYLEAWWVLGRDDCKERALQALDSLWERSRAPEGGMYHYFDGVPHTPGLLRDVISTGEALLDAHTATGDPRHLERAKELAEETMSAYSNPSGGFHDIKDSGPANLRFRLTPLDENSAAAAFLARLHAMLAGDGRAGEGARQALLPFTEAFREYGIASAGYGGALARYLFPPLRVTLTGAAGDTNLRALAGAALTQLGQRHLMFDAGQLKETGDGREAASAIYLGDGKRQLGPFANTEDLRPENLPGLGTP